MIFSVGTPDDDDDLDIVEASILSGFKGRLAVLYRALGPAGYQPPDVDRLEPWQAAVVLGLDVAERDRGLVLAR